MIRRRTPPWLLTAGLLFSCVSSPRVVGRSPEGAEIIEVVLSYSNTYLVRGTAPILIDAGSEGDFETLSRALRSHGVEPSDIRLVILTHVHADHAGMARELQQRFHAEVMVGGGDAERARAGHNDILRPTHFTAHLIRPAITDEFPGFQPDHVVTSPLSLARWGLAATVIPLPGHTEGSLAVLLPDRQAFVGDLLAGGWLGGLLFAGEAGEHYYHADRKKNRRNIEAMLRMGVETFFLGHGGPVSRTSVKKALVGN